MSMVINDVSVFEVFASIYFFMMQICKFSSHFKNMSPFLMILPVRGATGAANDVDVMSSIRDNGT